jgi:hypothetical protein
LTGFSTVLNGQNTDSHFSNTGFYITLEMVRNEIPVIAPQIWTQYRKIYFEARYNYEDTRTFSLYSGFPLVYDNNAEIEFVPLVGAVAGQVNGISPGFNLNASYKGFNLFTQLQYTFDLWDKANSFFLDWSTISIDLTGQFAAGAGLQVYKPVNETAEILFGPMLRFRFGNFSTEVILYNLWDDLPKIALGISYSFGD